MQAILLAAGQSSRLYPFTNGMHKSMIKILGKPLLEHTIVGLQHAGIKEIILREIYTPQSIYPHEYTCAELIYYY